MAPERDTSNEHGPRVETRLLAAYRDEELTETAKRRSCERATQAVRHAAPRKIWWRKPPAVVPGVCALAAVQQAGAVTFYRITGLFEVPDPNIGDDAKSYKWDADYWGTTSRDCTDMRSNRPRRQRTGRA